MILFFDIGNSYIKWALGGDEKPSALKLFGLCNRESIQHKMTENNFLNQGTEEIELKNITRIVISSVSDAHVLTIIAEFCQNHHLPQPILLSSQSQWGQLRNAYAHPERMGVDRWLTMIAAWDQYHQACMIVDCGSAITIDTITDSGEHLGGYIVPGLKMLQNALTGTTEKVHLYDDEDLVTAQDYGDSTTAAVKKGCQFMAVDFIDNCWKRYQNNYPGAKLIITGGDGCMLAKKIHQQNVFDELLIFKGMAAMISKEK